MVKAKYFRNKIKILGIEADSLWVLSSDNKRLVLVDDDDFVFVKFQSNEHNFYEVPNPQQLS